jgi:uncharacterized lipoprotein YmbA
MSINKLAPVVLVALLLSACSTTEGQFPSLERRPYESNAPISVPETGPAAPVELPAQLQAKVDSLTRRHAAAQADYQRKLPAVQALASRASGSAPGTESWVNAHLELSRLDQSRADSIAVVREFDSLIAEQGKTDSNLLPLLSDAQQPVSEMIAAQNAEIDRLSRLIGE